jgi:hypothetical protein
VKPENGLGSQNGTALLAPLAGRCVHLLLARCELWLKTITLGCDYWLASQLNQDGRREPGSPPSIPRARPGRNGIHFRSPRAQQFFLHLVRQAHPFVQAQRSVRFLHPGGLVLATNQLDVACSGPGWVSYVQSTKRGLNP